jgi:hypothetical protein
MNFFTPIPEGQAIIHSRGVYRQVPIFERAGQIYAKQGGGFVRLICGGATSSTNIRWAEIDAGHGEFNEKTGGAVEYIAPVASVREAAE